MIRDVVTVTMLGIDQEIEQILYNERVIGAAIGVVWDRELVWTKNYGLARWEEQHPPDSDTLFRIDSNTKTFTGTAILQLRDEGKLDLDDPLLMHLPEFQRAVVSYGSGKDVTLRRLLTHRAGLNGEAIGAWSDTGIGPTRQEMLLGLEECGIVIPPDSQHKYSNLGFILLGEVISRVSGMPYTNWIQENIFNSLDLSASTYDPDSSDMQKAVHYHRPSMQESPIKAHRLRHNSRRPGGGIYSTVSDMARWLSQQFRTEGLLRGPGQVLASTSLEEMHRPLFVAPDWESGQCIGWSALRSNEKIYLGHGGGNAGSASQTFFNKSRKIGVVILTNTSEQSAHFEVARTIMDSACAAVDLVTPEVPKINPDPTPTDLIPLIGRYEGRQPNSQFRVAWSDGSLVLLDAEGPLPHDLTPDVNASVPTRLDPTESPLVFIARQGRLAGETVTFVTAPECPTISLILQIGSIYRRVSGGLGNL